MEVVPIGKGNDTAISTVLRNSAGHDTTAGILVIDDPFVLTCIGAHGSIVHENAGWQAFKILRTDEGILGTHHAAGNYNQQKTK